MHSICVNCKKKNYLWEKFCSGIETWTIGNCNKAQQKAKEIIFALKP
jgi:hypothetical protein